MKSGTFCVVCKKEVSPKELADCEKKNTYGVYCGSCLEHYYLCISHIGERIFSK